MLVVVPLIALALGFAWWLNSGRYVTTDNSYVGADKSLITPQVTGAIVAVHVVEGQKVKVGDPLFDIDPKPYEIALALAKGKLEAAKVEFANLRSSYASNVDQIKMGEDAVRVRQADFDRKNDLAISRSGTAADRDTSMANLIQAKQILEFVQLAAGDGEGEARRRPRHDDRRIPRLYAGQSGGRRRGAQPAQHEGARADRRRSRPKCPQIELGRVAAAGQPVFAVVANTGPLGRRQSEGIGHDLRAREPARDGDGRRLPGPLLERDDLLDRAGHGRAIRDPSAAERERQLGQGRPARAAALLLRSARGHERLESGHERLSFDRHRPAAHARRRGSRASRNGRATSSGAFPAPRPPW